MPRRPARLFVVGTGRAVLAGLGFAACFLLAFPPFSLWFFAFLAPLPLMRLALWGGDVRTHRDRPVRPASLAFWAGVGTTPFWAVAHVWVFDVTQFGYVPMFALLGAFSGLFVWAGMRVRRAMPTVPAALWLPALWVGIEFFRGRVAFDGYPWYFAAHPLIDAFGGALAAPASVLGAYFVSFLAVLPAGVGVSRFGTGKGDLAVRGAFVLLLLVAWPLGGRTLLNPLGEQAVEVAVVQTNLREDPGSPWTIEQRARDWLEMQDLVALAGGLGPEFHRDGPTPDLVVLPEGTLPAATLDAEVLAAQEEAGLYFHYTDPRGVSVEIGTTLFAEEFKALQRLMDVPVLANATGFVNYRLGLGEGGGIIEEADRRYNRIYLLVDGQVAEQVYDKVRLTPFGEVMPYISRSDWLEDRLMALAARGRVLNWDAGEAPKIFEVPVDGLEEPLRVATPICFEATEGELCRRFVFANGQRRADLLVNQTNDTWFGEWDAGRETHLLTARWRCVELATPMIRAANTGVSAWIDARGRVVRGGVEEGRARVEGVLRAEPRLGTGVTVYARAGDVFGWTVFGFAVLLVVSSVIRAPRTVRPIRASE